MHVYDITYIHIYNPLMKLLGMIGLKICHLDIPNNFLHIETQSYTLVP